jgi:hypothetical protein
MAVVPHPTKPPPSFRCSTFASRAAEYVPCLTFESEEYATLCTEDTEEGRRDALALFFGDPLFCGLDPSDYPERLIVRRVTRTRAELATMPEWEP